MIKIALKLVGYPINIINRSDPSLKKFFKRELETSMIRKCVHVSLLKHPVDVELKIDTTQGVTWTECSRLVIPASYLTISLATKNRSIPMFIPTPPFKYLLLNLLLTSKYRTIDRILNFVSRELIDNKGEKIDKTWI